MSRISGVLVSFLIDSAQLWSEVLVGTVSIAVPFADRWYFSEIIKGASARIEQGGHTVHVHVIPPSSTATRQVGDTLQHDLADPDTLGAIIGGFKYEAAQAPRAAEWQRPIVLVGGTVLGYPTVMIDDIGAAREVTTHLRALGHRRIVHLAGTLTDQMDYSINGRRAKGYRQTMQSAGLTAEIIETEFDYHTALTAAHQLLNHPDRPTAIFAVSDDIAFAALDAARELGLRPGIDISIAGIDDLPEAEERDLTTIRQRPAEMGATAADMLLHELEAGLDRTKSRLSPIALITRGSTGRATPV